jgi:hypothetical protein
VGGAMKNWRKLGDAASNVVELIRADKGNAPPEYCELCDDFAATVDMAIEADIPSYVVLTAICHALSHTIAQMNPLADAEIQPWLSNNVPKIMSWAARWREQALDE